MNYPIVVITIAYSTGIAAGKVFDLPLGALLASVFAFTLITIYAFTKKLRTDLFLLILFALAGMFAFQASAGRLPGGHLNHIIAEENHASPLKQLAAGVNQNFNSTLSKILPPKEAGLLGSMLLGTEASPLPEDLKENYRKAGLIHLLVVSGMQVSIVIGVCLALTSAAGFPLWLRIAVTSLLNFLLVIVTGGGASILRAAVMGEIALVGRLFEREKEFYSSLALSALILLLFNPAILFDIGFQLSFAATWSLAYIAPVLEKRLPALLSITCAPIMATAPIIAYYFGQVSLAGIISNLLVLPWVEFLVILGFSTTLLGFIFLPLAQIFGNTLYLLLAVIDGISSLTANLPGACFYIRAPSIIMVGGYFAGLIFLIEFLKKGGGLVLTKKRLIFALLVFFSLVVWDKAISETAIGTPELAVTFFDVGQGDATLIETPGGKKVLIDGGGGRPGVVPFLHRKGVNHLDLVVLTHPHADHLGGLIDVLEEIEVGEVLDSGQVYDSQAYRRFKALIEVNKIKYSAAQAGQTISFEAGLTGYVLNPLRPFIGDTNSDSIVLRLVYGNISFMFTGDMEREGEERVRSAFQDLRSTILKVGHHGSKTSTSDEFLRAVNPQFAIISCGRHNRYRHPHTVTLDKLKAAGVKIYRTDLNGAVTVRTNGAERLKVEPQAAPPQ